MEDYRRCQHVPGIVALQLLEPALKGVRAMTNGDWQEEASVTITSDKRTGDLIITATVRLRDEPIPANPWPYRPEHR
jgi:hypothetical protein